jgi:hypothetical protein
MKPQITIKALNRRNLIEQLKKRFLLERTERFELYLNQGRQAEDIGDLGI